MKKFCLFVSVVFLGCASLFAQTEIAGEDEFEIGLTDSGGILIVKYTGRRTQVSIPAEIQEVPVREIGSQAFRNNKTITAVTIPEGVTSINSDRDSNGAFELCSALVSVNHTGRC